MVYDRAIEEGVVEVHTRIGVMQGNEVKRKVTSRERVQCVLRGELPDRVPFNFWMGRDKMAEYDERWGADFRLTHYDVDVIEAFLSYDWIPGLKPSMYDDGKTNWQLQSMLDSVEQALDRNRRSVKSFVLCRYQR